MTAWDSVADRYDETRGGEERGLRYASEIHARLPEDRRLVLEVGVGTGVVARGMRSLGRGVVGVDLSLPMISRASQRLGAVVARADGRQLPIGSRAVGHAYSVWVLHALEGPAALVTEVARVLGSGGHYVVCTTQTSAPGDPLGSIMAELFERLGRLHPAARRPEVSGAEILDLGRGAGLDGTVSVVDMSWPMTAERAARSIRLRAWPALDVLNEEDFEVVTGPALDALDSMAPGELTCRATTEVVDLTMTTR